MTESLVDAAPVRSEEISDQSLPDILRTCLFDALGDVGYHLRKNVISHWRLFNLIKYIDYKLINESKIIEQSPIELTILVNSIVSAFCG